MQKKCLPTSKFNHKAKLYCEKKVNEKRMEARRLRRIWILEGGPRAQGSLSLLEYKNAKTRFQNIQRRIIYDHKNRYIDDLNRSAEKQLCRLYTFLEVTEKKKRRYSVYMGFIDCLVDRCYSGTV